MYRLIVAVYVLLVSLILSVFIVSCADYSDKSYREAFRNPENKYYPMPFWHINGKLTTHRIEKQLKEARDSSGFGGVAVLPVTSGYQTRKQPRLRTPGMRPEYLSEAYFDRYSDILRISEQLGTEVILYDDINFPSGSAGGKLQEKFPEYTTKYLINHEFIVEGPTVFRQEYPNIPEKEELMAVSAMNMSTRNVIDLKENLQETELVWNVPDGKWRIMFFTCRYHNGPKGNLVDYMQPEAVRKFITMTYDEYAERFKKYFGNTITKTFFDDVGWVNNERAWTPAITNIFREKYGRNPALYYPALFHDIGVETSAARVAFFDIRSELMAEGYPKLVAEWCTENNLKSMGHAPENYSPNSVVANGDILKFYRHTQIPLMDAIHGYGKGIDGFKQISSAAELEDKPVVGIEIYGAYGWDMDSLILYRAAMETMARGANFFVPHGMWYESSLDSVRIPPLISHENPLLGDVASYSKYIARCSRMLQGGSRTSDVALLWPITAIQSETLIRKDIKARWVPPHVNHHQLSHLLTNELYRDFTFVHPEDLHNGKITREGSELRLNNTENIQHYKVLIIPGGKVISAKTLKAIKNYYDEGGKIIATSLLPKRSAEFGQDSTVLSIISEIFGDKTTVEGTEVSINENHNGGQAAFIRNANKNNLNNVFSEMGLFPDVSFNENRMHSRDIGYINYIHKQKAEKEIYFFINSTNQELTAEVKLRGELKSPELWNPHTGEMQKITEYVYGEENNTRYTKFELNIEAISSCFILDNR